MCGMANVVMTDSYDSDERAHDVPFRSVSRGVQVKGTNR
jgi:hypothetical protein